MSYARPLPPPRPYGVRPTIARPVYGTGVGAASGGAGAGALGGALGALGGTLGCLLCLSAIGALGLFACVVAITAYTKQFLDAYENENNINGADQLHLGLTLVIASLFYALISRLQRS